MLLSKEGYYIQLEMKFESVIKVKPVCNGEEYQSTLRLPKCADTMKNLIPYIRRMRRRLQRLSTLSFPISTEPFRKREEYEKEEIYKRKSEINNHFHRLGLPERPSSY